MGTLVKIIIYIFTNKNQPSLLHQNSLRLHYWQKNENFMENLKIRKYPFFSFLRKKIIKIIQNDAYMRWFCKNLIESIKICKVNPYRLCYRENIVYFVRFQDISCHFHRGRGNIFPILRHWKGAKLWNLAF